MKKLKIKLWRIENVVLMKVLEQDESWKGILFWNEEIEIRINDDSELCEDVIFIAKDNKVASIDLEEIEQAKTYYAKVKKVVQDYNKTLDTDVESDDVESEVVE
jgi:hypothetical protein